MTGLVTSEGHRDEIEIRRGYKEDIWDPALPPPRPICPRRQRYGVPERLDFEGNVVVPLDEAAVRRALRRMKLQGVESVAVRPELDDLFTCTEQSWDLHNGSVPTLRDLLEPPAKRPNVFWSGYDVYDTHNVGFIAQGPDASRVGTRYDTSDRANGNGGHTFGTDLPAGEKEALLEYLKTL